MKHINLHELRQIRIDYYRQVANKVAINIPTCSYKIPVFIPMLTKLEISRHISLNPSLISRKSFELEQSFSVRTEERREIALRKVISLLLLCCKRT